MSKIIPNIKERVLLLADYKEDSKQDFFRKVGLKYSNFTGKSKESDLSSSAVAEILLKYPEVNPVWLLTGKGEVNILEEKKPVSEIILATPDTESQITVPVINIKAAANYVTGYQTQEFIEELEAILLPKSMVGEQQHYAFQAIGDSMHPTIYTDDYILAKLLDPSEWQGTKENYIHVIVSNSRGVVIKRTKNRLKEKGFIRCKSDNRYHPPFNIDADDILQIFEVKCKLSFNLPDINFDIYNELSAMQEKIEELDRVQSLLTKQAAKATLDRLERRMKEEEEEEEEAKKAVKKEKVKQ